MSMNEHLIAHQPELSPFVLNFSSHDYYAAYFYRASESHGFTDASEFTLLTNTGMGDYANEPQYDTPAHNIRTQRLVRRWGRLAASVSSYS